MEWISVKDRLPIVDGIPTYDWCLVTSAGNGTNERNPITFARYEERGWAYFYPEDYSTEDIPCPVNSDYSSELNVGEITHWMPLPEPPKE